MHKDPEKRLSRLTQNERNNLVARLEYLLPILFARINNAPYRSIGRTRKAIISEIKKGEHDGEMTRNTPPFTIVIFHRIASDEIRSYKLQRNPDIKNLKPVDLVILDKLFKKWSLWVDQQLFREDTDADSLSRNKLHIISKISTDSDSFLLQLIGENTYFEAGYYYPIAKRSYDLLRLKLIGYICDWSYDKTKRGIEQGLIILKIKLIQLCFLS